MIARSTFLEHVIALLRAWRVAPAAFVALAAGCATTAAGDPGAPSDEVRSALTEAPELARIDPDVVYLVGAAEILGQREQFLESARYYRRAAELSDDPAIAARALRVAAFANDEELTMAGVERWLELDPTNPEPHRFAAMLFLRRGDGEAAWRHVEQLLAAGDGPQPWQAVGQLLASAPDQAAARSVLERLLAVEEPPAEPALLMQLSELSVQLDLLPAAERLVDKAVTLQPGRAEYRHWRGRIRQSLGRSLEAGADFEAAASLAPDNPGYRQSYAAFLAGNGDYAGALDQLEGVPDTVATLYSRSLYAEALDERERALDAYRSLAELELELDEASGEEPGEASSEKSFLLGQLAETLDRPTEEVLGHYREVTSGDQLDDAKLRSAVVLARDGQLPRARVMLHKLQNGNAATAARAYQAEAALLREAGETAEALAVYDRGLALLPDDKELLFARALHAESMDLIERTEADLRRILELDPDDPNALNALGYTLTDRTDRHGEALALIEAAYEQLPEEAAVVDSMGWVHFKLGNLETARAYLEEALALAPDPEIAAHLGEVLWTLGLRDEAEAVWERALADDPDAEPVLETRRRLLGQ